MNMDTNPIEAGLGFFIKTKKEADFVGKQAIKDILANGIKRKLVFLKVDATNVDPEGNETVWFDNKVVGNTTSGTYSCHLHSSLAMAYVPIELAKNGAEVQVELLGDHRPAVVMLHPPAKIEPVREKEAEAAKL